MAGEADTGTKEKCLQLMMQHLNAMFHRNVLELLLGNRVDFFDAK